MVGRKIRAEEKPISGWRTKTIRTVRRAGNNPRQRKNRLPVTQFLEFKAQARDLAFSKEAKKKKSLNGLLQWIDRSLKVSGGSHAHLIRRELESLQEKGLVKLPEKTKRGGIRNKIPKEKKKAIILFFRKNPHATYKEAAARFGLHLNTIARILNEFYGK